MSQPITLVIVIFAAVLCMISGPFGTLQSFSAPVRLAYWLPIIIVGACTSLFIRIVLRVHFPEVAKRWIETATVVLFTASFGSLLLVWSTYFTQWVGVKGFLPSNSMQLLYLAIVCGSFLWLRTFVIDVVCRRAISRVAAEPDVARPTGPRLLRRLAEPAEVLYLAAENHYVDVHTALGTTRLRMRFKDAIDEMEGVEGFCTHRSYWVNCDAILRAAKVNASWRLHLVNGDDIPVSRKYQPDLEAAGLLRVPVPA